VRIEGAPAYLPPWWLPGGHLQTVVPSLLPAPRVLYRRERWETPDADFIDVDWAGDPRARRLLVVFHGLEGSSRSRYARALAAHATAAGWRFALPHFRSCSGSLNRLPRAYHSGDSDEVDWILRRFAQGSAAVHAAGVSLGGNALLKWLGERGAEAARVVRGAAAVAAPLDLTASGRALDRGLNRRLYIPVFLATLKAKAFAKIALGQLAIDRRRLARVRTLHEFDDLVTAPLHGFRDADDYWRRASSGPWLGSIRVPTLVLNARNDPFLPQRALEQAARGASASVVLDFQRAGGHATFPGTPFFGHHSWMPGRVLEFFARL
jgi:hypothetical protein